MTSFAVQSTLGAAAPFVTKGKGSVGNRMDCAGEHIKNNAITLAQSAGVAGTTYLATKAVANNMSGIGGTTKRLAKVFDWTMKGIGKLAGQANLDKVVTNKINSGLSKIAPAPKGVNGQFVKTISKAPGVKALAVIASIALPAFSYISHKHYYNAGQIDQKYTDKAQLQKTL